MLELTKIISAFIIFPGFFVTFFAILAFYFFLQNKKISKPLRSDWLPILFLSLAVFFYLASSTWFVNFFSKVLYVSDTEDKGDYIVVLGGGIDEYSGSVEIGKHTLRRLYKGYLLYKSKPRKIVVTGGVVSKGIPEAFVMKDVLISFGVPEEDIIVEDKARNTFQNAQYTYSIIGDRTITLVTSVTHMKRSLLSFRKFFKEVYHVQSDVPLDFRNTFLDYIPTYNAFYAFCNVVYELVGLLQYSLFRN
uniref:YdcF family protein n=1 Tax=Fervidobacterium pennivorans TaxID=93466 RepID=A0A7V4KB84_FERPE